MVNVVETDLNAADAAAMIDRVIVDARRVYRGMAEPSVLERHARQAVADLWDTSLTVTAFVPVLALRRVGEVLVGQGQPGV